jgi:hypothetical protein
MQSVDRRQTVHGF